MRALLGLAALAAMTSLSPLQAQSFGTGSFALSSGGGQVSTWSGDGRHHDGRRVHVHRGLADAYAYLGYNDYGDFDGNRGFDPDKWNDWWHDRPDRAYPRWLTRNSDCARRWYSGDVLTC
jgi:hypothetical protein